MPIVYLEDEAKPKGATDQNVSAETDWDAIFNEVENEQPKKAEQPKVSSDTPIGDLTSGDFVARSIADREQNDNAPYMLRPPLQDIPVSKPDIGSKVVGQRIPYNQSTEPKPANAIDTINNGASAVFTGEELGIKEEAPKDWALNTLKQTDTKVSPMGFEQTQTDAPFVEATKQLAGRGQQYDYPKIEPAEPDYISNTASLKDYLENVLKSFKTEQVFTVPRGGMAGIPLMTNIFTGPQAQEADNYKSALDLTEKADKLVQAEKDNKSFVHNVGKGIGEALSDPNTWFENYEDLGNNLNLLTAIKKYEAGGQLTDADQKLMDAAANLMLTQASANIPRGYKAGQMTGQQIPFFVQLFLGGKISDAALKPIQKHLFKYIAKSAGSRIVKRGSAIAVKAAELAVRAGVTTLATQPITVAAGATGRMVGDVNAGTAYEGREGQLGGLNSFSHAITSQSIENFTEMSGILLAPGLSKIGAKLVESAVGKRYASSTLGQAIKSMKASEFNKTVEQMGWQGLPSEWFEEQEATILHSIFDGDAKIGDLLDGDQQLDIIVGLGVMGGFMASVQTPSVVGAMNRRKAQKKFEKADAIVQTVVTPEDYAKLNSNDIPTMLEATDNYSDPQVQSVMADFIAQRAKMQGLVGMVGKQAIEASEQSRNESLENSNKDTGMDETAILDGDKDHPVKIMRGDHSAELDPTDELHVPTVIIKKADGTVETVEAFRVRDVVSNDAQEVANLKAEEAKNAVLEQSADELAYSPENQLYVGQELMFNGQPLSVAEILEDGQVLLMDNEGNTQPFGAEILRDEIQKQIDAQEELVIEQPNAVAESVQNTELPEENTPVTAQTEQQIDGVVAEQSVDTQTSTPVSAIDQIPFTESKGEKTYNFEQATPELTAEAFKSIYKGKEAKAITAKLGELVKERSKYIDKDGEIKNISDPNKYLANEARVNELDTRITYWQSVQSVLTPNTQNNEQDIQGQQGTAAEQVQTATDQAEVTTEAEKEVTPIEVLQREQERQRTLVHNALVVDVKAYNLIPASYTNKRAEALTSIRNKAQSLDYTLDQSGNRLSVVVDGKPIRTIAEPIDKDAINAHQSFSDYEPRTQGFMTLAMPDAIHLDTGMNAKETEQALKNIAEGKKTVQANKLLDFLDNAFANNEVAFRDNNQQPGTRMSVPEYMETLMNPVEAEQFSNDAELELSLYDEVLVSELELLTADNNLAEMDLFNDELYNTFDTNGQTDDIQPSENPSGRTDSESDQGTIARTDGSGVEANNQGEQSIQGASQGVDLQSQNEELPTNDATSTDGSDTRQEGSIGQGVSEGVEQSVDVKLPKATISPVKNAVEGYVMELRRSKDGSMQVNDPKGLVEQIKKFTGLDATATIEDEANDWGTVTLVDKDNYGNVPERPAYMNAHAKIENIVTLYDNKMGWSGDKLYIKIGNRSVIAERKVVLANNQIKTKYLHAYWVDDLSNPTKIYKEWTEKKDGKFVETTNPSINDFIREQKVSQISQAEAAVDVNPSEAQKEAGNYKMGHVTIQDMDVTIENPKGSIRSGVDGDGKPWSIEMKNSYGYFKNSVGKDKDHIDLFLGENPESNQVFVIDQVNKDGSFDESKVMLGFDSAEQAKDAYLSNYEAGWQGLGSITPIDVDGFKAWLYDGARQNKAFAEYKDTPEPVSVAATKAESTIDTQISTLEAELKSKQKEYDAEKQKIGKAYAEDKQLGLFETAQAASGMFDPSEMERDFSNGNVGSILNPLKQEIDNLTNKIQSLRDGKQNAIDNAVKAEKMQGNIEESLPKKDISETENTEKFPQNAPKSSDSVGEAENGEQKSEELKNSSSEKIQDFGEKIGGAKKDLAKEWAKRLAETTNDALISQPLSKSFPKPDYKALVESGDMTQSQALYVAFLYSNIPAKPRKSYRVPAWAKKVRECIDTVNDIISGKTHPDLMGEAIKGFEKSAHLNIGRSIQLFDYINRKAGFPNTEISIEGFEVFKGYGETTYTVSRTPFIIKGGFETFEEAADHLYNVLAYRTPKVKAKVALAIYQNRSTKELYIGKSISGKSPVKLIGGFETVKDAHNYLKEHKTELETMWEGMNTTPEERRETNRKRVGNDWRNGKSVTPEMFAEAFGFRGVEFGNWVNSSERQESLNEAFDALMDLSEMIGVTPNAISLSGQLGLAFGARGSGKFSAHYESGKVVINLTKTKGAGSLAHEWFHALDNYFSRQRGRAGDFITDRPRKLISSNDKVAFENDKTRQELLDAFDALVKAINKSDYSSRSSKLDNSRSKDYWGTTIELGARAFENYVIDKLNSVGKQNDYLANFKTTSEWIGDSHFTLDNYPYPTVEESPIINEKFDQLFDTIQEDDNGKLFRSLSPNGFYSTVENALESEAQNLSKTLNTPVNIVTDMESLPKGGRMRNAMGWYDTKNNTVTIVLPNHNSVADVQKTLLHEIVAHKGLRGLLGNEFTPTMEAIFDSMPNADQEAYYQKYGSKSEAGEEYAAEQAETMTEPTTWQKIVAYVREAFRKIGINLRISDKDIAYLLWKSKNRMQDGDSVFEAAEKVAKDKRFKDGQKSESEFVDKDGKPITFYHGTNKDFTEFSNEYMGSNTEAKNTKFGFFFLTDEQQAKTFAKENGGGERIVKATLDIKNPIDITLSGVFNKPKQASTIVEILTGEKMSQQKAVRFLDEEIDLGNVLELQEELQTQKAKDVILKNGYDGMISNFGDGVKEYVAFNAEQIKPVETDTKVFRDKQSLISVYHGGGVSSVSDLSEGEPLYVSESKGQAEEYTKENEGEVVEFKIDKSTIADEDIAYDLIRKMGLKSQDSEYTIDELNLYELIDPKFDTSISLKGINRLFAALKKQGYTGVEFLDMNIRSNKNDIYNIVLFDPNKSLQFSADGSYLAPNGKPSNLTPKQYEQVRTPEFKEWFGDWENDAKNASKVVDANGEPLVVYHGTKSEFTEFGLGKTGFRTKKLRTFYFSTSVKYVKTFGSKYGGIDMPVFLNIRKWKRVASRVIEDVGYLASDKLLDEFEGDGYDGLVDYTKEQIVALNPNQIKSATENNGQFDPNNADIRFRDKQSQNMIDNRDAKIVELSQKVSDIRKEIKANVKDVKHNAEVIMSFARTHVNDQVFDNMQLFEYKQIMSELANAVKTQELDLPFARLINIIDGIEVRRVQNVLDNLLSLKIEDKDKRGVSVAKNVDEHARDLMSRLKDEMGQMKYVPKSEALDTLRAEQKLLQDEIKADPFNAELRQNLRNVTEKMVATKIANQKSKAGRFASTADQVLSRINALNTKGEQEGFTEEDYDELAVLEISQKLADIMSIDADLITNDLERQKTEKIKRGEEGYTSKRKHLVVLENQRHSLERDKYYAISTAIDALGGIVESGRKNLIDWQAKKIEQRKRMVNMVAGAIKGKKLPQLNEPVKESAIDKMPNIFKAPLMSFDFMIRHIDVNHSVGEGPLYKYFMRSKNGVIQANNDYTEGLHQFLSGADEGIKRITGKNLKKLIDESSKVVKESVHLFDEEGNSFAKDYSKGQALYTYMVWQMADGRAHLLQQNITEESISEIEAFIGQEYIELAAWLQDEYLPSIRTAKYNPTHIEMFGTSMAHREHYFPIKIDKSTLMEKGDLGEEYVGMPSTITGNIINRTSNLLPIDTNQNAFQVLERYGKAMEQWNAFAKVTEDLNNIRRSIYVKNQMEANEKGSFQFFKDASLVAIRKFETQLDSRNKWIKQAGRLQRIVAMSKISGRLGTALKQILSVPAILDYSSDPRFLYHLAKNFAVISKDADGYFTNIFSWANTNIPSYHERVTNGFFGNEVLMYEQGHSKMGKFVDKVGQIGMAPNRAVDAYASAVGAKAVYDFYMQRHEGMDATEAHNNALFEASAIFNETQQSSDAAYLSPMQADGDFLNRAVTTYMNNNIAYQRKLVDGIDQFRKNPKHLIEVLTKQYQEEGREDAAGEAKRDTYSAYAKAAKRIIMFGLGMPEIWLLGGVGILGFGGDDEDRKKALITGLISGWFQGVPVVGDAVEGATNAIYSQIHGKNARFELSPVMLIAEINTSVNEIIASADDFNISKELVKKTIGVATTFGGINAETIENVVLGASMIVAKNGAIDDKQIGFLFLINLPASQRKIIASKMYSDMPLNEYAERMAIANKAMKASTADYMLMNKPRTTRDMNAVNDLYYKINHPDYSASNNTYDEVKARIQLYKKETKGFVGDEKGMNAYIGKHKVEKDLAENGKIKSLLSRITTLTNDVRDLEKNGEDANDKRARIGELKKEITEIYTTYEKD